MKVVFQAIWSVNDTTSEHVCTLTAICLRDCDLNLYRVGPTTYGGIGRECIDNDTIRTPLCLVSFCERNVPELCPVRHRILVSFYATKNSPLLRTAEIRNFLRFMHKPNCYPSMDNKEGTVVRAIPEC